MKELVWQGHRKLLPSAVRLTAQPRWGHSDDSAITRSPVPSGWRISDEQRRHWSYSDYTLTGTKLVVCRRVFHEKQGEFHDGKVFEVQVGMAATAKGDVVGKEPAPLGH